MNLQIDKIYRTERLLDWEIQSVLGKYGTLSLTKQSGWVSLGVVILVIFIISLVVPFFPPRYVGNWSPPTSIYEYQHRVSSFLIIAPVIALVGLVYLNIRNTIDLKMGIKRIANFKVTEVIDLGILKILVLNGWRLFILRHIDNQFSTVAMGQIMNIKRTGTIRLINYYIRDEKAFLQEQTIKKASH